MGLLGNVLPGLRELRSAFAAGCIILLTLWIAFEPEPPDEDDATGVWKSLLERQPISPTTRVTPRTAT